MDEKKTNNWEKRIEKQTKELWNNHRVLLLVFLLISPFVFQLFTNVINIFAALNDWPIKFPSPGDWVGFWGSYLGVIPSGLIAALVAGYQIKAANKQSDEARKQELIIMRNTKIVDYLYEIKGSVSKSKIILDTSEANLSDKFMFDYLKKDEYNLFGEMNLKVLMDQNNHLYFLTGIVFDIVTDKKFFEGLMEYTKNLKLLQNFTMFYEREFKSEFVPNGSGDMESTKLFNEIRDEEKLKMMIGQLDEMSKIVDKRINELSA